MLLVFSHILAFSALFVASVFDLETSEVPDSVSIVGVIGGIGLHLLASYYATGFTSLLDIGLLFSQPVTWLQALGDPLLWSLGVGVLFSLYGWGLYFLGAWGGADAFAMSVLGFAAPYGISGPSMVYPVNLLLNVLMAGFFYTVGFAFYKSARKPEVFHDFKDRLMENEKRITLEILLASAASVFLFYFSDANAYAYFGIFLSMIFLYRYLQSVQEKLLSQKVHVDDLEGGEVIAVEDSNDKRVRGVTEDEIAELENTEVEVRDGVRFIPVFMIGLLITDLIGGGLSWIMLLIS